MSTQSSTHHARELECAEDEPAFEDKVRGVATAPKPEAEPKAD